MGRQTTEYLPQGTEAKYVRLAKALIRDAIDILSPGESIPSERELMEYYRVSRATVRRALDSLVARGIIVRIQGKGTFLATERSDASLLISFTEHVKRNGNRPSTKLLDISCLTPPEHIGEQLQVSPGLPQWRLERVRMVNRIPVCWTTSWYPVLSFPGFDKLDHSGSVFEQLLDQYGVSPDFAEQTVWSVTAEPKLAKLLQIPEGFPILAINQVVFAKDRPIEASQSFFRGDRYQLTLKTPTKSTVNLKGIRKGNHE